MCPPNPDPTRNPRTMMFPSVSPHTTVYLPSKRIFSRSSLTSSLGPSEQVTAHLTRRLAVALAAELTRLLRDSSSWKDMELNFEENN